MSTGGSALNWFARQFRRRRSRRRANGRDSALHQWLDRLAEAQAAGRRGAGRCCRIFSARKTPVHDPAARAVFDGLTLSHDIGHVWRALLEAYAYAIAHHVETLAAIGHRTERFIVSDGGSASQVWMQIVADVLQRPLQRLEGHPGSCVGVAWAAAIGAGLASDWSGVSAFVTAGDRIQSRALECADRVSQGLPALPQPLPARMIAREGRRLGPRRHADRQRGSAPSRVG